MVLLLLYRKLRQRRPFKQKAKLFARWARWRSFFYFFFILF